VCVRVCNMCTAGFYLQERVDGSHENSHGRKAVRVSDLPQFLLAVRSPPVAQEDAHGRTSVRVHSVRQVVSTARGPATSSETSAPHDVAGADSEERACNCSATADH